MNKKSEGIYTCSTIVEVQWGGGGIRESVNPTKLLRICLCLCVSVCFIFTFRFSSRSLFLFQHVAPVLDWERIILTSNKKPGVQGQSEEPGVRGQSEELVVRRPRGIRGQICRRSPGSGGNPAEESGNPGNLHPRTSNALHKRSNLNGFCCERSSC